MDIEYGFEFEGAADDGNIYVDSIPEFNMLTKTFPIEEVGIRFNGEIPIDDKTSVITDKKVEFANPEQTLKTYQKVMEMRDLTEDEIKHFSKFKLFLKKLFEVFFKNQKYRVYLTLIWLSFFTFEVATEDYLAAFVYAAAIALYNSPIKFAKEIKKMFGSKKRKEELREELNELNVMSLVNLVPEDEGIKLYFKPKAPNFNQF